MSLAGFDVDDEDEDDEGVLGSMAKGGLPADIGNVCPHAVWSVGQRANRHAADDANQHRRFVDQVGFEEMLAFPWSASLRVAKR